MLFSRKRENRQKKMREMRMAYLEQLAFIRRFKKDDEGGLIILTLLLLISMLVVGGMAVDFMRFESERTKLQSVSDRAVLAAANLNQELAPAAIVADFFKAEGFEDAITSNLDDATAVQRNGGGSTITITSEVNVNTFYLRLIGMDTLTAPAASSAIAGTGNVEVSLVLDISGSMGRNMTGEVYTLDPDGGYVRFTEEEVAANDLDPTLVGTIKSTEQTRSRMFFLQQAANKFVADLLLPEYEDRVSINLIAYSQHVALGDDLYTALKTTPDSISENGLVGSSFGEYNITDNYSEPFSYIYEAISSDPNVPPREVIWVNLDGDPMDPRNQGGKWVYADEPTREFTGEPSLRGIEDYPVDISWANGEDIFVNASRCVTFTDQEYERLDFVDRVYDQVEYVDFYSRGTNFYRPYSPCPAQDFQGIILMSQDVDELQDAISSYIPTLNTSIYRGMKWGTLLLDPSMRPIIDTIPTVDPVFRGSRPAEYRDGITSKYVVIMTDGETVSSRRVKPQHYDEYEERVGYSDYSGRYWGNNDGKGWTDFWNMTESIGSTTQLNEKLASLCTLAAAQVTDVYTISLGVNNPTMTQCASDDGNAFTATMTNEPGKPGMGDIFERISSQITALRLSQ